MSFFRKDPDPDMHTLPIIVCRDATFYASFADGHTRELTRLDMYSYFMQVSEAFSGYYVQMEHREDISPDDL